MRVSTESGVSKLKTKNPFARSVIPVQQIYLVPIHGWRMVIVLCGWFCVRTQSKKQRSFGGLVLCASLPNQESENIELKILLHDQ